MLPLSLLALLLAAGTFFGTGSAQVTTSCDPTKGKCPNDKGLDRETYDINFSAIMTLPPEWVLADATKVNLGKDGAEFTFAKRYDAPTMWTDFKFFFGRVEFVVKAGPGVGIVSSMVLLSDDLDEIDWEFLGGVTTSVQTNYFGKGYTGSYNRSTTPAVDSPQTKFHTYGLDWSPERLIWSIDGKDVRTLKASEADGNGDQYPQSPMKVSLGLWDAGDPDSPTKEWGGGVTPIPPPEPYTFFVKSVKIWNTNPAQQYEYTDQSGSQKSIKIIKEPFASSSSAKQSTSTLSLGSSTNQAAATSKKPDDGRPPSSSSSRSEPPKPSSSAKPGVLNGQGSSMTTVRTTVTHTSTSSCSTTTSHSEPPKQEPPKPTEPPKPEPAKPSPSASSSSQQGPQNNNAPKPSSSSSTSSHDSKKDNASKPHESSMTKTTSSSKITSHSELPKNPPAGPSSPQPSSTPAKQVPQENNATKPHESTVTKTTTQTTSCSTATTTVNGAGAHNGPSEPPKASPPKMTPIGTFVPGKPTTIVEHVVLPVPSQNSSSKANISITSVSSSKQDALQPTVPGAPMVSPSPAVKKPEPSKPADNKDDKDDITTTVKSSVTVSHTLTSTTATAGVLTGMGVAVIPKPGGNKPDEEKDDKPEPPKPASTQRPQVKNFNSAPAEPPKPSEPAKPEPPKPEPPKQEPPKQEPPKSMEPPKPEPPKPEPPKPMEPPKPEGPKQEPPKPMEPPKPEPPKPEPPKVAASQPSEPPKPMEPPKPEPPKQPEPPKPEPPKPEPPKPAEPAKPEPPKQEPPKPVEPP
ncbi:MAG: hypothetical protein Q9174_004576, partial [Haloplaca sp. 1 TL-2023]